MATPRNETTKSGQRSQQILLPHALVLIDAFCDTDAEVIETERTKNSYIFGDASVPWSIQWGHLDEFLQATGSGNGSSAQHVASVLSNTSSSNGPYRPEWLNSIDMRRRFEAFKSRARVLADRHKVVFYWNLDKAHMAVWLASYIEADSAARAAMATPFGCVESSDALFAFCGIRPGEMHGVNTTALSRLETLWWQPPLAPLSPSKAPDGIPKGVEVHSFMYKSFQFATPTPQQYKELTLSAEETYKSAMSVRYSQLDALADAGTGPVDHVLIPASGIYDLMNFKSRIKEARINLAQAEGAAIQPGVILTMNRPRLNQEVAAQTGVDALLDDDTRLDNMLHDLGTEQRFTYEQWSMRFRDMLRLQNPDWNRRPEGQKTSTDRTRLTFGRPARFENMLPLPEGFQATHVVEPKVLANLAVMEQQYRERVAVHFDLLAPQALSAHLAGNKKPGGGGPASLFENIYKPNPETPADHHLQHVIQNERNWVSAFFSHFYSTAFQALDMQALDGLINNMQHTVTMMREAKLAARALETALQEQPESSESEERNAALVALDKLKSTTSTNAGTKATRRKMRFTVRRIRELFEYLQTRPDAVARLEFQPGMTQRNARQLECLMSFVDRGMVDAKDVQPYFNQVFPNIKLHDPPAPDTAAPPSSAPAKKRSATPAATSNRERPLKRARTDED